MWHQHPWRGSASSDVRRCHLSPGCETACRGHQQKAARGTSIMRTHIGIVGLGNAGSAIATALSGKMPLVGFDIDPGRRQAVSHLALDGATSLAELAQRAGTVILSLPHPSISQQTVAALLRSTPPPELIIETSTVTHTVAQELSAMCRAQQVGFID